MTPATLASDHEEVGEEEVDTESMKKSIQRLRVVIIEDDAFTQQVLTESLKQAALQELPNAVLEVSTSSTTAGALAICSAHHPAEEDAGLVEMVLVDYLLPGGNADDVLPSLRTIFGGSPAVVMLSGSMMVAPMKECLGLGADAFRVKPVGVSSLQELIVYSLRKKLFITQRRSRPQSPQLSPKLQLLEGALHVLAEGRGGRVRIGAYHRAGAVVVIKELGQTPRGAPPPRHPHVNRVYDRVIEGGAWFEVRQLCDQGEFFDLLLAAGYERGFPPAAALRIFVQIVAAVAHCHKHGAVHGQLRPENVLLRTPTRSAKAQAQGEAHGEAHAPAPPGPDAIVQLTGFYVVQPGQSVDLRRCQTHDAPELRGTGTADAATLRGCDVWALGTLLLLLATGELRKGDPAKQVEEDAPHSASASEGSVGTVQLQPVPQSKSSSSSSLSFESFPSTPSPTPVGDEPRSRPALKASVLRLAGQMLQRDPAQRPTAVQLLSDLGQIQLSSPSLPPSAPLWVSRIE